MGFHRLVMQEINVPRLVKLNTEILFLFFGGGGLECFFFSPNVPL